MLFGNTVLVKYIYPYQHAPVFELASQYLNNPAVSVVFLMVQLVWISSWKCPKQKRKHICDNWFDWETLFWKNTDSMFPYEVDSTLSNKGGLLCSKIFSKGASLSSGRIMLDSRRHYFHKFIDPMCNEDRAIQMSNLAIFLYGYWITSVDSHDKSLLFNFEKKGER